MSWNIAWDDNVMVLAENVGTKVQTKAIVIGSLSNPMIIFLHVLHI